MKSSLLHPVLSTVTSGCAKQTVVRMTELVAALVTAHGSVSWHICYLQCQEQDEELMFSFF